MLRYKKNNHLKRKIIFLIAFLLLIISCIIINMSKISYYETLDWWESGRYVFPIGCEALVMDYYTKETFKIKRTMGTNHADCEAVTIEDSNKIKKIWRGWSWERRPVIIQIGNRRLKASMSAMPHAGLDKYPALDILEKRSGGYGRGPNLDTIKGNGMDGHIDVHFLNSTRHMDGKIDEDHQKMIKKIKP